MKIVKIRVHDNGMVEWEVCGIEGLTLDEVKAIAEKFDNVVVEHEEYQRDLERKRFRGSGQ